MPGKREKCGILLAHVRENADGAEAAAGEPDNGAPGAAKLALKRPHILGRQMKMFFEKLLQNVHESLFLEYRLNHIPSLRRLNGGRAGAAGVSEGNTHGPSTPTPPFLSPARPWPAAIRLPFPAELSSRRQKQRRHGAVLRPPTF